MCQVIAITNQKGGVGKTTTTFHLGTKLAQEGKRVLLIDADPQASLTASFGIRDADTLNTTLTNALQAIVEDEPIDPEMGIRTHEEGAKLFPANIELASFETAMINVMSREYIMRELVSAYRPNFDYILIDCMPSLGMRLSHMLRSGKELKVFAVKDGDLKKFCEAAKKYGVLYCVLKDKNAKDGISDVMVRAEDASKINRIMERFRLSTVDRASVKATVVREKRGKEGQKAEQPPVPEKEAPKRDELDDLLDQLMKKEPTKEAVIHENPTGARRAESGPSVPSSMTAEKAKSRMSVREELARIRAEQQKHSTKPVQQHKAPKRKKRKER